MSDTIDLTYPCAHCDKIYKLAALLDNHTRKKHPEQYATLKQARDSTRRIYRAQAEPSQAGAPQGSGTVHEDKYLVEPAIPAGCDPKTSVDVVLKGAEVIRNIARHLRNHASPPHVRERLARELDSVAFAFDFLYKDLQQTNYWTIKEKAEKWDTLIRILPTIESFLVLALETEAKHVQASDHD